MNFSVSGIQPLSYPEQTARGIGPDAGDPAAKLPGAKPGQKPDGTKPGQKPDGTEECQTCKNRKYQDGSDEMVSFKSAAHISPAAAASVVRSHEQEHVSNAYAKASPGNGKVLRASVTLHTAICPECGRSYISGGTTNTQIKYYNEENPYQQELKSADRARYSGRHIDAAV